MPNNVKQSKDFGKKEKVLNFACQTYQLSRPPKVGAVMALIRECQPATLEAWEKWYFENATTSGKTPAKITKESIQELGERLYAKVTQIVIPEWTEAFRQITLGDCVDYIYNLTIHRTYDGFVREKTVVEEFLQAEFKDVRFEESPPELDHAGDIDYLGWISPTVAIGIQIKPSTTTANFGNYSASERMQGSFQRFKQKFGGDVFVIVSVDGDVRDWETVKTAIRAAVDRLR